MGVSRAVLGALLSGWDPLLPPLQGKGLGFAGRGPEDSSTHAFQPVSGLTGKRYKGQQDVAGWGCPWPKGRCPLPAPSPPAPYLPAPLAHLHRNSPNSLIMISLSSRRGAQSKAIRMKC